MACETVLMMPGRYISSSVVLFKNHFPTLSQHRSMAFDRSETRYGFPTIPLRLQLLKLQASGHQHAFFKNELLERLTTLTFYDGDSDRKSPANTCKTSRPIRPSQLWSSPSHDCHTQCRAEFGATEEEIREFLGSISADERQKVLDALKIIAGSPRNLRDHL